MNYIHVKSDNNRIAKLYSTNSFLSDKAVSGNKILRIFRAHYKLRLMGWHCGGKGGKKIIKQLISLALAIIIIFSQTIPVYAINRDFGLDVVQFAKDVTVKAPQSTITLNFPVPGLAKVNSASAIIALTPGPQLSNESLFYFYHNDKLVDTRSANEFRQMKSIAINLPPNADFKNAVQLQVKSNMFISNDLCRDYYSGGLFFTINRGSKLNLNYDTSPVRSVADFLNNFQQSLLIVVPTTATLADMMPAVWAYGLLKKTYPHLDMKLVKAGDIDSKVTGPRVWVGLRNHLPAYFNKTQTGIALADPNTLLLSATTISELEATVRKLAELVAAQRGSAAGQKTTLNPVPTTTEKDRDIIFFGNETAQEGILQVATEFELYSSMFRGAPETIGFHIEGSHVVSFDQNRPVRLDVFFNSKLIHSSVLDQTGRFTKEVTLPSGAELLAKNRLKLQFNYSEEQGQCQVRGKLQSVQVFPSSYMWGTGQKKVDHFTWSNMGMFLSQAGTVLVDESLSENPLQLLAGLILFLNRQLPLSVFAFPAVHSMAELAFVPTDQYVVALADTGKLPIFLQDLMPGPAGQGSSSNQYNSLALPIEAQPNVKSVVGKIAEHKGYPVIVLSTNLNGNLMNEALRYLTDPGHYEQIVGNIFTYTQPGRLNSLDVRSNENNNIVEKSTISKNSNRFWNQNKKEITIIVTVLFAIMVLILLFGYLRRRRIERDSQYAYETEELDEDEIVVPAPAPKRRGRPKNQVKNEDGVVLAKPKTSTAARTLAVATKLINTMVTARGGTSEPIKKNNQDEDSFVVVVPAAKWRPVRKTFTAFKS